MNLSVEERLDFILDMINSGFKITKSDMRFLDSFSSGTERQVNERLNYVNGLEFLSDDGYFRFVFKSIENLDDCSVISGQIIIPDPIVEDVKMTFIGNILIFKKSHVAIDFRINEIDIFEFLEQREEKLDDFVSQIIEELGQEINY